MKRRSTALLLGVALPTVLLGAGWMAASLRERSALRREQQQVLVRTADAVRGAVDESLEELRRREDRREFYLYNPYYSPPAAIALNDPLVASPLADEPDDPRVVGYFQIVPSGEIRTPYALTPEELDRSDRGRRVVAALHGELIEALRPLSEAPDPLSNPTSPSPLLLTTAPTPPAEAAPEERPEKRPEERPEKRPEERPRRPRPAAVAAAAPSQNTQGGLLPQGPLTTNLDVWNQAVIRDIRQAQAGDPEANQRIQSRGRAAPITRRNTVDWSSVSQRRQRSSAAPSGGSLAPLSRPRPSDPPPEQPARQPAARARATSPPSTPSNPDNQAEVEVDYTPMAFRITEAGTMALHRVVSHQETSVVQGVVLDREVLLNQWIPSLIQRRVVTGTEPRVVERGEAAGCALRRPVSSLLEEIELCFDASTVRQATAEVDAGLGWQAAALAGLVLLVLLAGVAIDRAGRRAEELSAQKSAFVSSVSHELRTPLTTIRMHAEMLREGLVPEAKRDRFHQQLVHEAVRLSQLVENVLELSRLEEGRRRLELHRGDLGATVAEVIAQQRPLIEERGFELDLEPSPDELPEVAFDAQALSQIVINLLDNAVKYGGGEVNRIEVTLEPADGGVRLSVTDHGGGVPEKERAQVFERFHRVHDPEREHMPGTGIGLALVQELIRGQGGEVELGAAAAGGCEVRIYLPAAPD